VLHRRVQEAGEDELRAWRAGCLETCLSGSEGGGWKRARKSNALAAYLMGEGVQGKVDRTQRVRWRSRTARG